ncbi:MAG: HAD family hydrolase [Gammaproteobacteria bacterium]|nr:HAD family hydrolase [Gammaproteobacteria bacterium]
MTGSIQAQRSAIFLDRDGVINAAIIKDKKPYAPLSLAELKILPQVKNTLETLRQAGFLLIIITNQPEVARGTLKKSTVEKMHQYLRQELPIDDIFVCYHDNQDKCNCRKPLPGLILKAAEKYSINLSASFMVGDRSKDIAAGKAAGLITIWLKNDYAETKPITPDYTVAALPDVVDLILQKRKKI